LVVTIAVFGISGVGKSWLISRFANTKDFAHLQASQLLRSAKSALEDKNITAEDLRRGTVLDNQALLISSFKSCRSIENRNIIFDGHNLVDTGGVLIEIPVDVVEAIDPAGIILVWADPAVIADHRRADANRSRPVCSLAELEKHQARSDVLARSHANYLRVPFHRVQSGDENLFALAVRSIVDGRFTE
jgi:adenylate kinase